MHCYAPCSGMVLLRHRHKILYEQKLLGSVQSGKFHCLKQNTGSVVKKKLIFHAVMYLILQWHSVFFLFLPFPEGIWKTLFRKNEKTWEKMTALHTSDHYKIIFLPWLQQRKSKLPIHGNCHCYLCWQPLKEQIF